MADQYPLPINPETADGDFETATYFTLPDGRIVKGIQEENGAWRRPREDEVQEEVDPQRIMRPTE